jgi:hypothetical protein
LLVVILAAWAISIPKAAHASDSEWLLCDDGSLALNLFEHRAADGMNREADLKLLLGDHLLLAVLKNVDSGPVNMKSPTVPTDAFAGKITIDYAKNKVTLKGKLTLNGQASDLKTSLACKELRSKL